MTSGLLLTLILLIGGTGAPGADGAPGARQAGAPGEPAGVADFDEVLLDLRMGRLSRRLVPALARGDTAYLPVSDFLELAEVRFSRGGDWIQAVRQPGNVGVRYEAGSAESGVVARDGRLHARASRLEADFGLRIELHWEDLVAAVVDPGHLPVGLRAARELRWGSFQAGPMAGRSTAADRTLGTTPYRAGGFVADWSVSANAARIEESAAGSLSLGSQLLGGSLRLSARSEGAMVGGSAFLAGSYHLARPGGRVLRQLRLGDGLASGPRPRTMTGVHLTNAPYRRESFFGYEAFQGRLGPGWEVELRQAGQTVDLRRADEQGAFALDIPLRYGDNALEIIGYGPHGEMVTMDRLLLLRSDRLPIGHLEWGLSAGACRVATCQAAGNLDLRYGLTRGWTVRAGVEGVQRDSLANAVLPYLELGGAPWSSMNLSAEWLAGNSLRGTLFFTPSPNLRLRGAATRFENDPTRAIFHDRGRRATLEVDAFLRPLAAVPWWSLTASAVREARDDGEHSRGRALGTVQRAGFRLEGGVQSVRGEGRLTPVASLATRIPGLGRGLNEPLLRVEGELNGENQVDRVRIQAGRKLAGSGRIEVGTRWSRAFGSEVTASLSADLPAFRSVSQWFAPRDEPGQVIQYLHGSIQWDEAAGRLRTGTLPALERSGVSGVVYLDENGNGRPDPGEPTVPGVRVVVEGRSVTTDAEGRYSAENLTPFEATRVSIHAPSVPNPTWLPVDAAVDIPLAPSSFRRLDLPLQRTGEVSGRVVKADPAGPPGETGLAGAEILLSERGGRGRTHATTTFFDGGFYFMGIPPGDYELRLAPGILSGLGLSPESPRRNLVVDPSGTSSGRDMIFRLLPDRGATP
ncbi:MAG: hypothetical protein EA350_14965 [Gemmatimonadales bacterium]|nr:MAG: hypothetical protein EA350_14965 [Gemmatimonadales bacterium]